jgi:hypothetical protein
MTLYFSNLSQNLLGAGTAQAKAKDAEDGTTPDQSGATLNINIR